MPLSTCLVGEWRRIHFGNSAIDVERLVVQGIDHPIPHAAKSGAFSPVPRGLWTTAVSSRLDFFGAADHQRLFLMSKSPSNWDNFNFIRRFACRIWVRRFVWPFAGRPRLNVPAPVARTSAVCGCRNSRSGERPRLVSRRPSPIRTGLVQGRRGHRRFIHRYGFRFQQAMHLHYIVAPFELPFEFSVAGAIVSE